MYINIEEVIFNCWIMIWSIIVWGDVETYITIKKKYLYIWEDLLEKKFEVLKLKYN